MTKEEAIKTLRELWRETNDSWYEETYNMAIEALEQMPPADPNGYWVYTPTSPLGYTCSECGKTMCRFSYCPNCGARMII